MQPIPSTTMHNVANYGDYFPDNDNNEPEWINIGYSDPPPAPEGFVTEVKRDSHLGIVTDYRYVRPVVAPQQPAPAVTTTNPADAFRNMFAILHNTSLADLNRAQVITDGNPLNNKQWDRFNNDLTTFVLKLDDARLDALYALVQARQPVRYRERKAT